MRLTDILTAERIIVDSDGGFVHEKIDALRLLAHLLAPVLGVDKQQVERLLAERETLQSTGIGDGVAIPHTSLDDASQQAAALLLCPHGVDFDAIDGAKVNIIFGVVGPRRATGEHLKALARISRLLRDNATRAKLVASEGPGAAFALVELQDAMLG
jgi:PTS system nitrogen regulatory IIA component